MTLCSFVPGQVDVPKFFNRVTTLLQAKDAQWKSMKTVGALRSKKTLPVPVNHDSLYKVYIQVQGIFIL